MSIHIVLGGISSFVFLSGRTQEEGLRRVQELKAELASLKEANKEEEKKQLELQQQHATLTEELAKERVTRTFFSASRGSSLYRSR